MNDQLLTIDAIDTVAHLTLTRPDRRNALTRHSLDELARAVRDAGAWSDGILLSGAGGAFSAGADLRELHRVRTSPDPAGGAIAVARSAKRLMQLIESSPVPVVACVDGPALGGGFELALACDWICATPQAMFALPEPTLGLLPGFGGVRRAVERLGPALARELILGGRLLDAEEGLRVGLVSQIHPTASGLVRETAASLRRGRPRSRRALALARAALVAATTLDREAAFARETQLYGEAFEDADSLIGMTAFLEKQPAEFATAQATGSGS